MEERISTFTLFNGRQDIYSHTLGSWGGCRERHLKDSFINKMFALDPYGYSSLADQECVSFSCPKGHALGDCKHLRAACKKNLGNEGNGRNQDVISLITALSA